MSANYNTGTNRAERQALVLEAIRRIVTADPELTSTEVASRVGCTNRLVQRVVKAMKEAACAT